MTNEHEGKKDEAPDSKGSSQDSPVLKDNDDLKIPEEFDYLAVAGISGDDSQLLDDIYYSMLSSSSSKGTSSSHRGISASPPKSSDLVKLKGICIPPEEVHNQFPKRTWLRPRPHERGEASWSVCLICGDDQPSGKMIERLPQCGHFFCQDCMRAYVGRMIGENIHWVKCPDETCRKFLTDRQCCNYLPEEVAYRWFEARNEARVVIQNTPTYIQCPFKDCSARFVEDGRGFLIRACPVCWRIFCMICRARWHMGLNCEQFKRKNVKLRIIGPKRP